MRDLISFKKINRNRVWEVDFLRGCLILFVVFDHIMFDIGILFSGGFTTAFGEALSDWAAAYAYETSAFGLWRKVTHSFFIGLFVILSGVSVSFSRNNGLRGLKMSIFAVGLSTCMLFYCQYIGDKSYMMNFNVLHVLALSILLWALLDKLKPSGNFIFLIAVFAIAVGSYFNDANQLNLTAEAGQAQWTRDLFFWVVNNDRVRKLSAGDYLPFFPYFGWFLLGGLAGRAFYKKPFESIVGECSPIAKPFCWCGRHSLVIYFASQILAVGLLTLIVDVLGWL